MRTPFPKSTSNDIIIVVGCADVLHYSTWMYYSEGCTWIYIYIYMDVLYMDIHGCTMDVLYMDIHGCTIVRGCDDDDDGTGVGLPRRGS